jgi:hypothetical protein
MTNRKIHPCHTLLLARTREIESRIILQFFAYAQIPEITLIYLLTTNGIAMLLFLGEGLLLRRKTRTENAKRNANNSTS